MEPNQTPTQANTTGSLDPQAVNLAKAIRQTESGGNFQASGKSGEYGAYQWMPGTWATASKAAGVDVPLQQSTLEQQNQVAYHQIETWKNEGYTPAQIASMWNAGSGNPDAYTGTFSDGEPSVGTNSSGVQYNVPQYVDKVTAEYQKLKWQSDQSNPPIQTGQNDAAIAGGLGALGLGAIGATIATDGEDLLSGAGDFLGNIGKGLGAWLGLSNQNQSSGSSDQSQNPQSSIPQFGGDTQQATQASSAVHDAIMQSLQGTQPNRNYSQTPEGKSGASAAAMFNLIHPDENGNLAFDKAKSEQLQEEIGSLFDKQIAAQDKQVPTQGVISAASDYIGNSRLATNTDRKEAQKYVQQYLQDDAGDSGEMSLSQMRKAQKEHGVAAGGKYGEMKTSSQILAHKALRDAYGEMIRQNLDNKDLYDRTKKMQQALIQAEGVGKRLSGKKAPMRKGLWESFLRQGARAAEIYIGDRIGGPIGAIIGGMVGEGFNRKIEKHFGRNIFETKGMKAAMDILQDTRPKEYQEIIEALKKDGFTFDGGNDKVPETTHGKVDDVAKDLKIVKGLIKVQKKSPAQGLIKPPMERIKGKSTGFPAKQTKAPMSPALKALMSRKPEPKSKALKKLERPLPRSKRAGQMSRI